ncbi:MAG: RNA degradosome polyphosphate kinase [Acidimicrobiales bacterium]|nr:RNA degradosome polyphosphate kinase [Acidimicrobiales bacterium]
MAGPTSSSTTTVSESAPAASDGPPADAPPERYRNRELSWLDFNARVLSLAEDTRIPLLERAKFLAIFGLNLDEFFQVRVAGLKDQVAAGVGGSSPDGRTSAQQLLDIRDRLDVLLPRMQAAFLDRITPALAEAGIKLSSWADLDEEDEKFLVETFEERIFPVLTPLAVDPGHPFPYISNLSLNLAVIVRDPDADVRRFARVKVPSLLPRFVVLPDGERYVPLEQVMAAHLDQLFPGMEIEQHHAFRVTRNSDLTLEEEEADDLLAMVELELRRRRFGRAVRLEIDAAMSEEVRELLQRELDVADEDVYVHTAPLDLGGLWAVHALDRPDLKDPPYQRVTPPRLARTDGERVDFFAAIRRGDLLVHHPYESFRTTVEEFVRQAANDPRVLAIKMTLYRTSGDSPIARSLIRAAERGKQVAVIVELKARFDEGANIEWARQLETAGVHVTYGLIGLKVHSKATLVVREESDGLRRYCHVGTGNYNSKTARIYEDVGLLTCDPAIGADMSQLFNELTGYGRNIDYQRLLVAPRLMRDGLNDLIQGEIDAGPGAGHITMKMNSLVDPGMIEELYRASQAGVEIDLIVRGICCLNPGVPGLSETIRVRSIVGRYLEHSRIFRFANGLGTGHALHLVGSADLMPRNLDRRVEVLTPVSDVALQQRLDEVLDVELRDDVLAWSLGPDGRWTRAPEGGEIDSHVELQQRTVARAAQAVSASVV